MHWTTVVGGKAEWERYVSAGRTLHVCTRCGEDLDVQDQHEWAREVKLTRRQVLMYASAPLILLALILLVWYLSTH
jgi:hypothetical protein